MLKISILIVLCIFMSCSFANDREMRVICGGDAELLIECAPGDLQMDSLWGAPAAANMSSHGGTAWFGPTEDMLVNITEEEEIVEAGFEFPWWLLFIGVTLALIWYQKENGKEKILSKKRKYVDGEKYDRAKLKKAVVLKKIGERRHRYRRYRRWGR